MEPIGLTFKREGFGRQGELMLIHQCVTCRHISINRLAADDSDEEILGAFEYSCRITDETASRLRAQDIVWLVEADRDEVRTQIFGKV